MNITNLYTSLSYGELSNLAMGMDGTGEIRTADKPRVLNAANEALLLLHSRFILSTKHLWLQAYEHIKDYHLDIRFSEASSTSQEDYQYIRDIGEDEFTGDVIKVIKVYDANENVLPLNDTQEALSVFTPQAKTIRIPAPVNGTLYKVEYQAKHAPLALGTPTQEIYLPEVLHTALYAYIAYRIYSGINTAEANGKASEHLGNYEAICQNAIDYDLLNTYGTDVSVRFTNNGWV